MSLSKKVPKDIISLLYEGSTRVIPFNIFISSLLSILLIYNNVPILLVGLWFSSIFILSITRLVLCKKAITRMKNNKNPVFFKRFIALTLITGIAWTSCYFLGTYYLSELHEFIIILTLGGMCAGGISSLSAYLLAYYAFMAPILAPIIIYNFSLVNIDRAILATMFSLLALSLVVFAKFSNSLINKLFILNQEKENLIKKLKKASLTDPLTQIFNRRRFDTHLPLKIHQAKSKEQSLMLISIDVDNFKLINDNLGHPAGDKFLIIIATLLKKTFKRKNETAFRVGGDEFAVIVIDNTVESSKEMCAEIKNNFERLKRSYVKKNMIHAELFKQITLSIGIVSLSPDSQINMEKFITEADKALYHSKAQGKNRIVCHSLS